MNKPAIEKKTNGFLSRLKEYKEFISILIFFAGGAFWIYGFFATKSQVIDIQDATTSQVKKLTCALEQNVKMLRGKMEFQYFTDLLDENKQEIRDIRRHIRKSNKNGTDTGDSEDKLFELNEQRNELKAERDKFKKTMETALNLLTTQDCSK